MDFDPSAGVLYLGPPPPWLRWPTPPHFGAFPTHEEYDAAGTCDEELLGRRCSRRADHVGVLHKDGELVGWWLTS